MSETMRIKEKKRKTDKHKDEEKDLVNRGYVSSTTTIKSTVPVIFIRRKKKTKKNLVCEELTFTCFSLLNKMIICMHLTRNTQVI
jgi:hypothetical protein